MDNLKQAEFHENWLLSKLNKEEAQDLKIYYMRNGKQMKVSFVKK
ncbi:hypothetical protein IK7_02921 [Bacillus cereus VD156]|nr:hypothetical protein IK7_02921 [Bacillus cereus VD156]